MRTDLKRCKLPDKPTSDDWLLTAVQNVRADIIGWIDCGYEVNQAIQKAKKSSTTGSAVWEIIAIEFNI